MRRSYRFSRVAVAAALTAALAACGAAPSGAGQPAAAGFPVTLTDVYGQVTVPKQPVRVAALDQSYVDATIALETPVVAFTSYRGVGDELPAYLGADVAKYAAGAKSVGTLSAPNLEMIAAAQPDLIVSAKVRHGDQHERLVGIAPTVFSESTGPTWKENIRLLGKALGKSALADQKIAAYEQRAKRIGDAVRAKLGRNPTVSLVRFAGEPTVRLYSKTSFPGTVLTDAGFALNATASAVPAGKISADVSQENLLQLDADHLFLSTARDENGASAAQKAASAANPLWNRLTGEKTDVQDLTWLTAVGLQGAGAILDDVAKTFGVAAD
ncbi:ABC transporter substrate-binding protein [Pseudonocardia sp. CA-107938]|uniref:ABC transporter substrate-binding protein n=1 Tax=Pseudonocardia sp. CA-107938 TaxID=3240021 RepID=UPI003D8F872A